MLNSRIYMSSGFFKDDFVTFFPDGRLFSKFLDSNQIYCMNSDKKC